MRLFIAAEVPEGHKRSIEKAIQPLRLAVADARWTTREQWHCTMKFLGEVPDERVGEVEETLAGAVSKQALVETHLTELGAFPRMKRARVLWVGLADPEDRLVHLAARLEKKLGAKGFRKESRRLHPHVTLARLKEPRSLEGEVEGAGPYDLGSAPFTISELVLFRSRLSPKGATYEAVGAFPLG